MLYRKIRHLPVALAGAVIPRTHAQVTALFGDLPLVAPGVVPVTEWRPTAGLPHRHTADLHAGMARIPYPSARRRSRA
jgi:hypothetical protein